MEQGQGSSDGGQGQGSADAGQGQGAQDRAQGQGRPDGGAQSGSDDRDAVIARLNAEAKDWREKFEATDARIKEIEQGQMSEIEKANARSAELEQRALRAEREAQEARVSGAIRDAAVRAQAADPDLLGRAIDFARVEYDANGRPTNLDALVEEVKTRHPVLFNAQRGSGDGGARGAGGTSTDMNELIRRGAGRSS